MCFHPTLCRYFSQTICYFKPRMQVEPEATKAVPPPGRAQGLATVAEDILSGGVDSCQSLAWNPALQQLL